MDEASSPDRGALPAGFYERRAPDRFAATPATMSPWDPRLQHGGPPSALLAAYARTVCESPGLRLTRLSVDFLGPIPLAEMALRGRIVRPGKQVCLVEVSAEAGGREVVAARAWFIASKPEPEAELAALPARRAPPPALPHPQPQELFPGLRGWGYGEAIEWRFVEGGFASTGPARVWTRTRVPLIAGEPFDALARALIVADSANGLAAELGFADWLFIPPGIAITLDREPAGEWVYLEASTHVAPDGVGVCGGSLGDRDDWLGLIAQPLLVTKRAVR